MSQPIIINEIENRLKLSGGTLTGSLFINNGYAYVAGNADESIFLSRRNFNDEKYLRYISISSKENIAIDSSITFVEKNNDVWKTYKLYGEHNKPTYADVGAKAWEPTSFGLNPNYIGVRTSGRTADQYYEFWDSGAGWADIRAREFYAGDGANKVYHAGNKPTPADIGALSSSGGTITGSLTISNATYNKSLSIGHGENNAFWYNSKSGKYVQHKDNGIFSFDGNQILDASNYTNYAVKKAYSDKVPFALSNNLFTVNKTLNWNASSYYKWVYLLLPCLTATNYSGDNIFDGEFYLYKNGACIFDIVHVRMNCIYNNMVYNIQSTGDHSTGWKIVRCKYGGIWYYALEGAYHANPYNRTHFFGHVKSDLNGGLAQLALPYTVAYYNDNTKTVLNSEIYNSLTTTLTDTYCTYVYKHKTYMNTSLITEYGTTDYTTNKVRNTAANTSLGSLGNGDTYLVYA